jgi:hypothetical protein
VISVRPRVRPGLSDRSCGLLRVWSGGWVVAVALKWGGESVRWWAEEDAWTRCVGNPCKCRQIVKARPMMAEVYSSPID